MIIKNKKWVCIILAILIQLGYSEYSFARYLFDTQVIIEEKLDNILNLPKNTLRATERVTDAVGDLVDAAGSKGVNQITDYQKSTAQRQAALKMHRENPTFKDGTQVKDVLNNKGKYSPEQYQAALNTYSGYVAKELGVDESNVQIYSKKDKKAGMSDNDRPEAYINARNTNVTDTKQLVGVTSHELGHQRGENETEAERSRTHGTRAWDRENQYNGDTVGKGTKDSHKKWVKSYQNSPVFVKGNQDAGKVSNSEDMSIEGYFRWSYFRDTGRNMDSDFELLGDPLRPIRQEHYTRNVNNNPDLATIRMPVGKDIFHTQGPNGLGNVKYVSVDGHHEAVRDIYGNLVIDSLNMGTYNESSPDKFFSHGIYDVSPYLIWGNSQDDPTTKYSRLKLMLTGK